MSFIFDKVKSAVEDVQTTVKASLQDGQPTTHMHTHHSGVCSDSKHEHHHLHRFQSFAPQRQGNDVKW